MSPAEQDVRLPLQLAEFGEGCAAVHAWQALATVVAIGVAIGVGVAKESAESEPAVSSGVEVSVVSVDSRAGSSADAMVVNADEASELKLSGIPPGAEMLFAQPIKVPKIAEKLSKSRARLVNPIIPLTLRSRELL